MPILYRQIPLHQATAGMVLSDNLLDSQGKILMVKDVVLTDKMLAALRRRQIESLSIVSGILSDEEFAARRRHHKKRLARLFRKPWDDAEEATGILMRYMSAYRLGGDEA